MRKILLPLLALSAITTISIISCNNPDASAEISKTVSNDSLIRRGDYLVSSIGCDDCHSPKIMGPQGPQLDMEHRLSGYPAERPLAKVEGSDLKNGWMLFGSDLTSAVGPWGISFASNLTSDSTGIGNWTEAQFFTAIRQGKSKGIASNRELLPPMPWQNFSKLSDADLKAIFAYLKSTKPVRNVVPAPKQLAQL